MAIRNTIFILILIAATGRLQAQDTTLLNMLNDSMSAHKGKTYVTGTFKADHIVNAQTVESPANGNLNFVIQHRFGQLNSGAYNFFGLDNATLRLGLDYGITDDLSVAIGRSSYLKTFDGYVKGKVLKQTEGNQIPVTVDLLGTIVNWTQDDLSKPYLNAKRR